MNNFSFFSPTYFLFGKESHKKVGNMVKKFQGKRVLVVYGGNFVKGSGLIDQIIQNLVGNNIEYVELGGVTPNPESKLVYEGINICKCEGIDFILAIGGGSVIDSAKAIAAGSKYNGDFWDFYVGKRIIEDAIPIGTVLTIFGSGSEGSPDSVITNGITKEKRATSSDFIRPTFSILNPELTMTLSDRQTATGIVDILSHLCERYFSNTKETTVSDELCESLFRAIIHEADIIKNNPSDYNARANIMWAGMLAHNDICGVDRDQDWSSHRIEHELSTEYNIPHGIGMAIVLPAWMEYVVNQNKTKFRDFALNIWDCNCDDDKPDNLEIDGIKKFKEFLKSINMPTSLKELGLELSEGDIEKLVQSIGIEEDGTLGNYVKLNVEDIKRIYRIAR